VNKKRIALCLSGFVGTTGKHNCGEEIDYHYGYENYMHQSILSYGDVDVFIHSWSVEHSDGLGELYKPVKSVYETDDGLKFKLVLMR
jgi:hypothetical protein